MYHASLALEVHAFYCWPINGLESYSKHPNIRTHDFGIQADLVLIYRVLSENIPTSLILAPFSKEKPLYFYFCELPPQATTNLRILGDRLLEVQLYNYLK